MNQDKSIDFFVGLMNAVLFVLPFYFLLYWIGFLAIPIYFSGSIILAISFMHSANSFKEKRIKKWFITIKEGYYENWRSLVWWYRVLYFIWNK